MMMTFMTRNTITITDFSMSVKARGMDRFIGPQHCRIASGKSSRSTSDPT